MYICIVYISKNCIYSINNFFDFFGYFLQHTPWKIPIIAKCFTLYLAVKCF